MPTVLIIGTKIFLALLTVVLAVTVRGPEALAAEGAQPVKRVDVDGVTIAVAVPERLCPFTFLENHAFDGQQRRAGLRLITGGQSCDKNDVPEWVTVAVPLETGLRAEDLAKRMQEFAHYDDVSAVALARLVDWALPRIDEIAKHDPPILSLGNLPTEDGAVYYAGMMPVDPGQRPAVILDGKVLIKNRLLYVAWWVHPTSGVDAVNARYALRAYVGTLRDLNE